MSNKLHSEITGTDLHSPKAHASSHKNSGSDEILLHELGEPTSAVTMNSQKITSLATPTEDADASTKKYVDDKTTTGVIPFIFGKVDGTPPVAGDQLWIQTPNHAITITKAVLLADQSGSIVIDIWECTYAEFDMSTHPVDGDSITASAPPTISTALKSEDSTLTDWTVSIPANTILLANVDSITDIEQVTLNLHYSRTL